MLKWLFIFIVLSGCGVRPIQYLNTSAPFNNFRSYSIINLKGQNVEYFEEDKIMPKISSTIISEMTRRGYMIDNDDPQLLLRYELIANTSTNSRINNDPFSYNPYGNSFQSNTFTESILLVELINRSTKKLVWQASLDLKNHQKTKKRKDPIEDAIFNIFNTYLYRAGESEPDQSLIIK